jgi:DNA repair exonuclease SbcCD ATPase subunit
VTAPTSLEALAAEFAEVERDQSRDTLWRRAFGHCALRLRTYLAARPASDLEKRLRGEADRIGCRNGVVSDKHTAALLLEAADDQAKRDYQMRTAATRIAELEGRLEKEQERSTFAGERIAELEREENALRGAYEARGEQIAELESELAEVRSGRAVQIKRGQMAVLHKKLARVEELLVTEMHISELKQAIRQALATPAQPPSVIIVSGQLCARGLHSFSWREAGQPCRYCGAPPKPTSAKPKEGS